MIFEFLWIFGRLQASIQIALAFARLLAEGQRVGDRYESDAAAPDNDFSRIEGGEHLANGLCAAGFIAMHRAEHDQSCAVVEAGMTVCR